MYDASLDQFKFHTWSETLYNDLSKVNFSRYSLPPSISGRSLYNVSTFFTQNITNTNYQKPFERFPSFKNFGYHFTNIKRVNRDYYKKLLIKSGENDNNLSFVYGTIKDSDGLPLPDVNIIIKGTSKGTQTDFDGNYILKAKEGDVLVFSYVGFDISQHSVNKKKINLRMRSSQNLPDHMYIMAYSSGSSLPNTWQSLQGQAPGVIIRGKSSINYSKETIYVINNKIVSAEEVRNLPQDNISFINILKGADATSLYGTQAANGVVVITTKNALQELQQVDTRTNLQETAFFFPQLKTNKEGEVSFQFKSPEALTRWKFQALAHDKNLHQAKLDLTTVTQKELNILPNFPRFFRSKDSIIISAKVNNLSDKSLNGIIQLEFTDELTQKKIELILDAASVKNFNIPSKGNTEVSWKLTIPEDLNAVRYRIVAKAGNFSDSEENIIPVFTNRIFITEALPIWLNPKEEKTFSLGNLKNNTSPTLKNHQLIFEYTSNPVWTAIKALPYLVEYPYQCAEQTFAKFYANTLALYILNQNPEIEQVLNEWSKNETLTSELNKNEELKNILIAETPWLKTAQSQEEQQKRIAQLLEASASKKRADSSLAKLAQMQLTSGAFPWFTGGKENTDISLHILTYMEKLEKINNELSSQMQYQEIKNKLIIYLDKAFLTPNHESYISTNRELNYLYARSFNTKDKALVLKTFGNKTLSTYQKNWVTLPLQSQTMLAIIAHRFNNETLAKNILTSLTQNAVINSDYGMYWKELTNGYSWYNDPIAVQSLAIEAFYDIENDKEAVQNLKTWLLRNKKTDAWKSTKATTEAIYVLLKYGYKNASAELPRIKIGDKKINPTSTEAATGYFKTSFSAKEIEPKMAFVEIKNESETAQYGGLYWQYFEESHKIKENQQQQISITKEVFKKVETHDGSILKPVIKEALALGDIVVMRLVISAKENFSFMHLKDMRAAGLEPIDVISKYKYQDGLAYYQSTKDVATHFFFDHINKGTYVLEYELKVNNKGVFSNGITQLQSMYSPEFSVQTKGIRLQID